MSVRLAKSIKSQFRAGSEVADDAILDEDVALQWLRSRGIDNASVGEKELRALVDWLITARRQRGWCG